MNKIKINSLVEFAVSQIKISGEMFVAGKRVDAGVNKTLDSSVVSQLPTELVQMLTMQAFGADYTAEELEQLATQLSAIAELKRENGEEMVETGEYNPSINL